jgi:hypothetical protein
MKSLILSFMFFCAAVAAHGAMADDGTPSVLSGRVQALYVKIQPGVFRPASVSSHPPEVWAEVKTYDLPGSREHGSIVLIRTSAAVERGDIVSFRPADETIIPIAPMPAESRILAITAKRGTTLALMYGSSTGDSAF